MNISLPVSKSIAARLLVIALLSGKDPSYLLADEPGLCVDLQVMQNAVEKLHTIRRTGGEALMDIKESGTARRLLTALCACLPGVESTLLMSQRLTERPAGNLKQLLDIYTTAVVKEQPQKRQVNIIGGKYSGIDLPMHIDTSRSSQTCTALMLVAPTGKEPTRLRLSPSTVSTSYIRMTATLMRLCGINVEFSSPWRELRVEPGQYCAPEPGMLERDWSAASYFYLYTLLSGESVTLQGLLPPDKSVQGDAAAATIFSQLGVDTEASPEGVSLTRGVRKTEMLDISLRDTPDLAPAVAVACVMSDTPFLLRGLSHLRYKESDRLCAIADNLRLFGADVRVASDSLECRCGTPLHAPEREIASYNDHRIAMSMLLTSLRFPEVCVDNTVCIAKSFPGFLDQFKTG